MSNNDAQPADKQGIRFAIDGAIAYGMQGVNPPPTPNHWLTEYWNIGRQLASLAIRATLPQQDQQAPRLRPHDMSEAKRFICQLEGVIDNQRATIAFLKSEAAKPAQDTQSCAHRIVDIRNDYVESDYMCVDCNAVFADAEHAQDTQDSKDADMTKPIIPPPRDPTIVAAQPSAWINVADRLPPNNVDAIILFWPYDNRENMQMVGQGHHVDGVFYNEDGDDMHSPSHWMPLPAPPVAASARDTQDAKDAG